MQVRIRPVFACAVFALTLLACSVQKPAGTASKSRKDSLGQIKFEDSVFQVNMGEITVSSKPLYNVTPPKYWNLLHTRLEVKPLWNTRQLEGKAILTLSPNAYPQDSLSIDARHFNLQSVSINNSVPDYTYDSSKIHFHFPAAYSPGDTLEITIRYTANPYYDSATTQFSSPINRGLYFINANNKDSLIPQELWSQGETQYNSNWFPTLDVPDQKQTQEIYITADKRFTTLSNGTLVYSSFNQDGSRTDCWEMKQPMSTYLTMIAIGNWKITKDQWHDSIPVDYYVEPAYAPYAKMIFGKTPEMLSFYSGLLHYDYPWPSFRQVVARDFVAGAMENTTAVVHFEELQQNARGLLDVNYEEIICHELFHHWFGDLVTPESWPNLTLSESFATIGENLWIDHSLGRDEEELHRQQQLLDYLSDAGYRKSPLVDYSYRTPEELFDHIRYEKGGLTLMMLRYQLGDKVFFNGLHIYLQKHAYQNAEAADLREALEESSGIDLHPFFNQWYFRDGNPDLQLSYRYDAAKQNLILKATQKENTAPFTFPLEADIYTADNSIKHIVWQISHNSDSFSVAMPSKPECVVFDPSKTLLANKNITKAQDDWYYQFNHSAGYLNRYEALQGIFDKGEKPLSETERNAIIRTLLHDPFWKMRQLVFTDILPVGVSTYYAQADSEARYDPNSKVRAAALNLIAGAKGADGIAFYKEKLNDSSYDVDAAALQALSSYMAPKDSAELLRLAARFDHTDWPAVAEVVATIYSHHPSNNQAGFFHHMPYYLRSMQMGKMIESYKRWLVALPEENIENELNFIENLSVFISDEWTAAAYKALLNHLATQLETKGGKSRTENREKAIESLRNKANSIRITKN
jgi:aminopeptidase N